MRLFVAIDIPSDINAALDKLIGQLHPTAKIRWSPPGNFHITTKFIGEWPEERLEEVKHTLEALPSRGPIPIQVHRLGYFPNPHSPRVFWAGIDAPPELAALADDTDHALAALGVQPESRPFSPHLTLARIKEPVPMQPLRAAVAGLPSLEFGQFTADRFFLYQSRLIPGGSVYTKLSEFPL